MVVGEEAVTFGALLRRYRVAAALSQEALAERAGISSVAISALERGTRRAPYLGTVEQLATAMALDAEERATLIAAARTAAGEPADAPVMTQSSRYPDDRAPPPTASAG